MRECFVVIPGDFLRIPLPPSVSGKAYLTEGYTGKFRVFIFRGRNMLTGYGDNNFYGLSGRYIELEDKYFCCIELPNFYA